jgi:hypothetical protein
MKKLDAMFLLILFIAGIVIGKITANPIWFVGGFAAFTYLPANILSKRIKSV